MVEQAFEKIMAMYSELETNLLNEIVKHFKINEEFINSDNWRMQKLEELGLLNNDIVKYISTTTGKTPKEIKKALNEIGINSVNMNDLDKAHKDGFLKIDPSILMQKQIVQNLVKHSYNELTNRFLQVSDKIEAATRDAYLNVMEKVYLQTTEGITYQEAIRGALLELGNQGITTLRYKTVDENGNTTGIRNYDVEGAVRRELLTASHNLVNNINIEVAEELNVEYLYLSEHIKCREQHFPWQGTIIKRQDLVKVTKLGEVDGMGGPNCKHYPTPYFGLARGNELKKITQEEAEEQYKLSQQQRYLERGIRKWKRKERIFKTAEDKEYYEKCKDKVKEWQLRNKKFTENNNFKRDFSRENIEKVTKDNKSDIILQIPNTIEKIAKEQNQVIDEKARNFIDINMNEKDLIVDEMADKPYCYNPSIDKIVINPKHEDISFYDVNESIIHEITHMKDIRNKIIESNYSKLEQLMLKSKMYINNNYNYFYEYLYKNKENMSLCDILSSLSDGRMYGDFGHFPEYWKNNTIILNELSANLISADLMNNKVVEKLLEEIPPLKEIKEECIKLWQV